MAKKKQLTQKQKQFALEYCVDLNGAGAARRAGYAKNSGKIRACELLQNPAVRANIRRRMASRIKRVKADADRVIRDLADIAHIDKSAAFRVIDGEVHVTDTDLLPESIRRCISEVSQTQHGIRIRFDDRTRALEMLGRHFALFTDNLSLSGTVKTGSIDDMSEEDIDAELARAEAEEAQAGEGPSNGSQEPA